ncbi:DUF2207 domain-containing protein [Salimicrobium halophilum]|uniref:Uncharacterized membrane protein n=1 Tax=Salimicrobium halophilum TaxID=86666 RepID=A0A1G8V9E3_9BACI|nr:DUF2207 domain-containing protein [Salimicrobium halophilum]SDJ62712.1 Uncharacterized membrane protein [Salimicrobium halophilum]
MRKIMLLLSLLMVAFPVGVFAVEYEIEETMITAELQNNGNVEVEERHTYNFEGEFNGITRTLIPKDHSDIENVTASEDGKDLEVEQEGNLYRIYRSGEDETVTIDISYIIEDGVEMFTDVGQFYWPFFDDRNESDYDDMTITVVPPEPTEAEAAYGYDEAYDTADISSGGEVTFRLGEVPSDRNGDIRVAYNAEVFPKAELTRDEDMLPTILGEKNELDEAAAIKQERQEFWRSAGPYIIGAFAVVAIILLLIGWRRRQETLVEAKRQMSASGQFPNSEMSLPAMLMFANYGQVTTPMITSSLLELVRKGCVEKVSDKEFRVVHRNTDYDHETDMIEWLFDEVGQEGTFHIEDLEVYLQEEENLERYQESFHSWSEAVKKERKQHHLYEKNTKARWVAGLAALAILPFIIIFPFYGVQGWMVGAIVLFAYFALFAGVYSPYTIEGQRLNQELKPLKAGDQWKDWEEKDQITAFLYQIGAGKRKPDVDLPTSAVTANDLVLFMILAGSLNHSFEEANQHTSAAASAGTGVAGGGGGVGGGGGGSGAF